MNDPYDILGVTRDASADDVKAAFRREASRAHPDRQGGSGERMAAVNEAYAVLGDPDRRRRFDETGSADAGQSVEDEATQLLAQIFGQAIQQESPQIVEFARGMLEKMRSDLAARVPDAAAKISKLEARRDKVRTKGGAANLVHGLIDAQAAALRAMVQKLDRGLQVAEAVARMLDAYDEDQPPPQPAFIPVSGLNGLWMPPVGGWR